MFGRQQSAVLERTPEGERPLGSLDINASDYDERMSELLEQAKRKRRSFTVRLSNQLGLCKILDVPFAAEDDLDQVLRFEMDRFTPFAGGTLRSTQILPAARLEDGLGYRRTRLRVHFVVTIGGLAGTLHELEPYLIIDDITVRQERVSRRRRNAPQREPMLDVSLELFGYVREESA